MFTVYKNKLLIEIV